MPEYLFVYGTLLDSRVLESAISRLPAYVDDSLEGFRLSFVKTGDKRYPNVIPAQEGTVPGKVIEVTPEELLLLDAYEVEKYARFGRVIMSLASGRRAWVYLV